MAIKAKQFNEITRGIGQGAEVLGNYLENQRLTAEAKDWIGKTSRAMRDSDLLNSFFNSLTPEQRRKATIEYMEKGTQPDWDVTGWMKSYLNAGTTTTVSPQPASGTGNDAFKTDLELSRFATEEKLNNPSRPAQPSLYPSQPMNFESWDEWLQDFKSK